MNAENESIETVQNALTIIIIDDIIGEITKQGLFKRKKNDLLDIILTKLNEERYEKLNLTEIFNNIMETRMTKNYEDTLNNVVEQRNMKLTAKNIEKKINNLKYLNKINNLNTAIEKIKNSIKKKSIRQSIEKIDIPANVEVVISELLSILRKNY